MSTMASSGVEQLDEKLRRAAHGAALNCVQSSIGIQSAMLAIRADDGLTAKRALEPCIAVGKTPLESLPNNNARKGNPMEKKPTVIHDDQRPIRPNMLMLNADATSSTIAKTNLSHSVITEAQFFNSRFHESNLSGTAYDGCDFDGAVLTGCSLRGVSLVNCDVDNLVINGINVGTLLRLAIGEIGGK